MSTFTVTATDSVIITATSSSGIVYPPLTATATVIVTAVAGQLPLLTQQAFSKVVVQAQAEARVVLAGDPTLLRNVLRFNLSNRFPLNFALVPDGLILMANGIDPMLRWDGQTPSALLAGVPAPLTAPQLIYSGWSITTMFNTVTSWSGGQDGTETITTTETTIAYPYYAYVRFLDRFGNVSDLSPVSDVGQAIFRFTDGSAFEVPEEMPQYPVDLPYTGYTTLEGSFDNADQQRAYLASIGVSLPMTQVTDLSQVAYSNVPLPSGLGAEKVVRRQILRNTAGQASTFYVDIDTTDMTSTSFLSDNADVDLLSNEAVPLFDDLGAPLANTHGFPPSWKSAVVSHLGRVFATADAVYDEGSIQVTADSTQVQGVGTAWPITFVGRTLYPVGSTQTYLIDAVDTVNQVLTLDSPYLGASNSFNFYAIRAAPGEWRLIYYTPAGSPESWPPIYALELVEDGDELTGLMALSSFLYILEKRHIYRFTFKDDPATDGAIFLSSQRGVLNQRCWVQAEDTAYLLDEQGIHSFAGGQSTPISEPIQDLFRDDSPSPLRINWDADTRYWHACYSEVHGTVRFFVAMTGNRFPRHAICYNYREDRWWLEEYHRPVCSSTRANLGIARVLVGFDHREVGCLNVGYTDGLRDPRGTIRGTVSASSALSLSDYTAMFSADSVNLAVFLVSGLGKGQWRRVVALTTNRLELLTPWLIVPRPRDQYIVGGIDFQWRAGWFRMADELEADNDRSIDISFQPIQDGSMDLQLYYNHVEQPRPWSRSADGSVAITEGDSVGVVDLTQPQGRAIQRLEGHLETFVSGDRYVSPELSGVQAGQQVRVYRLTLNGAEESG